jgi:putative transposase
MRDTFSITELCDALDVSRAGYHAAKKRPASPRASKNQKLLLQMRTVHSHRHTHCYGSPRMTRALRAMGETCSENRIARIMRTAGLRARPRKPFHPRTTRADHRACPSPNLQKEEGPPRAPGHQVVSDITYIPTREGWLYLVTVMELYSRRILGWKLSETMHATLVTGAIEEALQSGLLAEGALFHSDRGCQYTAGPTRQLLARAGLRQSMSAQGDCYDNAFAESLFATIKNELLPEGLPFETKAQARTELFDYIESFYNRTRLHSALGYKSPNAFLKEHFANHKNQLN